jgi:hypothetical protein
MGKKLGLDDKYKILQGYKPAPRVRNIDPGMVSPGIGLFPKVSPKLGGGPKGKFSSVKSDLGIGTGIMGKIKNVLSKKSVQVPSAAAAGYEIGKAEKKPEGKMYGGSAKKYKKGGMSMKDKKIKKVMGEYKKGELNIGKSKKKVKIKKTSHCDCISFSKKEESIMGK